MKWFWIIGAGLVAALFGPAGCAMAKPPASDDPLAQDPESVLIRIALVTADIDRSARFYRDVLGFEITFDGDITKPVNRELLSLDRNESARFIVLRGADQIDGIDFDHAGIGLLAIEGRDQIPALAQPRSNALASGQAMMAVVTEDLDAVIARARTFGAPILVGPTQADTRRGREREIVLLDPDNTRIHVVETEPAGE